MVEKGKTNICHSVRIFTLIHSVVTEKPPQHRRSPPATNSFDPTPTQQSLPYDDVEHHPGVDFDRMLVSFPRLMARVRQFTIPL